MRVGECARGSAFTQHGASGRCRGRNIDTTRRNVSGSGGQQHCGDVFGCAGELDRDGRYADDGGHRKDILEHDRPGTDDGLAPQRYFRHDCGSDADEDAGLDIDAAGDSDAGADVRPLADHGLVVDDAAGIEDDRVADLAISANNRASSNYDVASDRGVVGEGG